MDRGCAAPQGASPAAAIKALLRAQESGNANLANLQLSAWPAEVFDPSAILDKDKWWEARPLQKLDMSGNAICSLPSEIASLVDLLVLILQHNTISAVSSEICQLQALQTLDLSQYVRKRAPDISRAHLNMIVQQLNSDPSAGNRSLQSSKAPQFGP